MKTIQKLEFGFGVATLVAAIFKFYFEHIFLIKKNGELSSAASGEEVLIRSFLFLLLPAVFVFVGGYFHAFKQSSFGLVVLLIGSSVLVLILLIGTFSGAIFYFYGFTGALVRALPHCFAAITGFLGLRLRSFDLSKEG